MRAAVVEHDMDRQLRGDRRLELVEELDEVHRVVPCHIGSGDFAGGHIERGDQRRGAVTDVLELAPLDPTRPDRLGWVLA